MRPRIAAQRRADDRGGGSVRPICWALSLRFDCDRQLNHPVPN